MLSRGRYDEGMALVEEVIREVKGIDMVNSWNNQTAIECLFYGYAYGRGNATRKASLREIPWLLKFHVRSHELWPQGNDIAETMATGHPDPESLITLAAVVKGLKEPSALDAFPEWKAAIA